MNALSLFAQMRSQAKIAASFLIISLLLSAFPAAFFVAEAANNDAVGDVTVQVLANPSVVNGEYFIISFSGTGTLNLDGWIVADDSSVRHTFTATTLLSGDTYKVCQDTIVTSGCDVQMDSGASAVWNNTGDTLTLTDDATATVLQVIVPNPAVSDQEYTKTEAVDYTPIVVVPACSATDSVADTTFDTFALGDIDGQNAWSSTGPFDQAVVENTYGYAQFGCKSLRISNSVTSGSFGDQTFAAPFADSVGEVDATAGSFTEGTRYNHYEAEFDIASTKPLEEQSNLAISVSPDRGDGSRMSYLAFADTSGGIDVTFYDTQGTTSPANFSPTSLSTLDRSTPHTIKFVIDTNDGPDNDVVKIYIDGSLVHTGSTWENYYRYDAEASTEQSPRLLKTILFRSSGTARPGNEGEGFLIDNLSLDASNSTPPPPPQECEFGGEYPECYPEPQQCTNLLSEGSFEQPIVDHVNDWDRFSPVGGWVIERISDNTPTTLELHRNWKGNQAAHGDQYAELDGDWSTRISQTVATLPRGEYKLSWAYAARHNIAAEQNQLSVLVNGLEVDTEGPGVGINNMVPGDWAQSSYLFTATTSSTSVTFADAGPSNSYGTFIDDVQLCLVKKPEPVRCEMVSDTNTVVMESDEYAVETYDEHPSWTAVIPGASWVWETFFVQDPVGEATKTFVETFTVDGGEDASLIVSADNSYKVYLNNVLVHEESDEFNFFAEQQETYDLSSYLVEGENTFKLEVKNWVQNGGTPQSNPAGALYKLTITAANACVVTTETTPDEVATLFITNPVAPNQELPRQSYDFMAEYNDDDEIIDNIQWAIRTGTCAPSTGTIAGNVDGFNDTSSFVGNIFTATLDTSSWAAGEYCFVVNPNEQGGEEDLRATQTFTLGQPVTQDEPTYTISGTKYVTEDEEFSLVEGWYIELTDGFGEFITSTTTDDTGYYYFEVDAGDYRVYEGEEDGWEQVEVRLDGVLVETDSDLEHCSITTPDESDYTCNFYNREVEVLEPVTPTETVAARTSGKSTGTKIRKVSPQVLGVATSQCSALITEYMKMGQANNPSQVYRLQAFLIVSGYTDVTLTGVFDAPTDIAVKDFQEAHRIDVLAPWVTAGILQVSNPTGWVYQLTKWKINNIYCPGSEVLPTLID